MADEKWPDLAAVTAALESGDDAQTPGDGASAKEDAVPSAEEIAAALTQAEGTKPAPADAAKPSAQPQKKEDPKPDAKAKSAADLNTLAAQIKEDPRKALATLPEDVVEAMQSVLYPKLHQKLSKRDNEHRAEITRLARENAEALTAVGTRVDERIDEILSRTMDPEQFEAYKADRTAKADAEKAKNAPTPEEAARQAELQAYVVQAWDMIQDAGLPIPEDRTEFSDMTEETKAVWQAGWNEKTPIAAMRAMRAKIKDLAANGKIVASKPKTAEQPRDTKTGRFVTDDDIAALIARGVKAAREDDELKAGLSVTGARSAGASGSSGKAQSWQENSRDLATALREANARS